MLICGKCVSQTQKNAVIIIKSYHLFIAFCVWPIMLVPAQQPVITPILIQSSLPLRQQYAHLTSDQRWSCDHSGQGGTAGSQKLKVWGGFFFFLHIKRNSFATRDIYASSLNMSCLCASAHIVNSVHFTSLSPTYFSASAAEFQVVVEMLPSLSSFCSLHDRPVNWETKCWDKE